MSDKIWDCVVVGAGVIGLNTAYNLTKRGVQTLVLEQFRLPHTRGSSHGQSRILRKSHNNKLYTELADESYSIWQEIEKESQTQLMLVTGLLLLGDASAGTGVELSRDLMAEHNLEHEYMTAEEIRSRYPMIRYSSNYKGLLDKTAAVLYSDTCLRVLQNLILHQGGVIQDGVCVKNIHPGTLVTLETNQGNIVTKNLVIATGPWSKDVLSKVNINVPLKTMPGLHVYWKGACVEDFSAHKVPMFNEYLKPYNNVPESFGGIYLFPSVEYPGSVKVVTRGEPAPFYCHPDERDLQDMTFMTDYVADYIKEHFPGLETKPTIVEPCMYCMTPDKFAVIDRHPVHSNIIIGTGFSGKGYIVAPVAGCILGDLVLNKTPKWDLSLFSLHRFKSLNSKL